MKHIYHSKLTRAALAAIVLGVSAQPSRSNVSPATVSPATISPATIRLTRYPVRPLLLAAHLDSERRSPLTTSPDETSLPREWSFLVEKYLVHHQGLNTLNIAVNCTYKTSLARSASLPDSSTIYRQITEFLDHYSSPNDYWEVVNRNLTQHILQQNPALSSVTVKLEVLANQEEPYTRSTIVTGTDDGSIFESWSFITAQVAVHHRGGEKLNIRVKYLYQDGISSSEYPDFIPIYHRIAQFLYNYANDKDSWETVNCNLADTILKEYPMMVSFTSKIEVMPTQATPYHYFTAITRSQSDRAAATNGTVRYVPMATPPQ